MVRPTLTDGALEARIDQLIFELDSGEMAMYRNQQLINRELFRRYQNIAKRLEAHIETCSERK